MLITNLCVSAWRLTPWSTHFGKVLMGRYVAGIDNIPTQYQGEHHTYTFSFHSLPFLTQPRLPRNVRCSLYILNHIMTHCTYTNTLSMHHCPPSLSYLHSRASHSRHILIYSLHNHHNTGQPFTLACTLTLHNVLQYSTRLQYSESFRILSTRNGSAYVIITVFYYDWVVCFEPEMISTAWT